jgi:mannose-6-phosphate isomerase class I
MLFGADQDTAVPGVVRAREAVPIRADGFETRRLCRTPAFSIERIDATSGAMLPIVTNGVPVVWMLLKGSARLEDTSGSTCPLRKGDTVLLPAMISGWTAQFTGPATFLRIAVASPLDRAIV